MKRIDFITRSDDLGSSRSANRAIEKVVNAGFIRNVSIMACGPEAEDAARLLAGRKDICFGMHTTLNAEWDQVKWKPVLPLDQDSGLVDENGYFLPDPSAFLQTKPSVSTIMAEVAAQLKRLRDLGFDIRYIDSHMFPEMFVPGMDEAMEAFAKAEGLEDHMYFYQLPPGGLDADLSLEVLSQLPAGQYFMVSHPSLDTEEMRMTGNAQYPGELVAKSRAAETALLSDPGLCTALKEQGIYGIRYDEAKKEKRLTVAQMAAVLTGNA